MSFADAEAYQLYILAETDYSEGALLPKFLPKNGGMIVQVCGNARVTAYSELTARKIRNFRFADHPGIIARHGLTPTTHVPVIELQLFGQELNEHDPLAVAALLCGGKLALTQRARWSKNFGN